MEHRKILLLALSIALAGNAVMAGTAHAQLYLQSNPAFSTPTPATPALGPKQKPFEGKVVEFQMGAVEKPEGDQTYKIQQIDLEGNIFYNTWTIKRNLKALIQKSRLQPLTVKQIEDEIALQNQVNPYQLKATVKPAEPGSNAAILHLDVYEQQPWQISSTTDNQGRPAAGLYRGGLQMANDSLFGFGDQLKFNYTPAERSFLLSTEYKVPVNARGGAVSFNYAYNNLNYGRVEKNTPRFDPNLVGRFHCWTVGYEQPIDRKRVWTPYISFGFASDIIRRDRHDLIHSNPRPLSTGLRFKKTYKYGATNFDAASVVSEDWLGGTNKFWRFRAFGSQVFNLPFDNKLTLRGGAQFTPNPLPVSNDIQIGGEYTNRGYSEGLLTGDHGYWYQLEHQWPIPFLHHVSPFLGDRIRMVDFFDFGQVWFNHGDTAHFIPGVSDNGQHTLLASAGFGIRARINPYMQGFCDVGFGLVNRSMMELNGSPQMRVLFGIRSDYLPKKYSEHGNKDRVISQASDMLFDRMEGGVQGPKAPASSNPPVKPEAASPEKNVNTIKPVSNANVNGAQIVDHPSEASKTPIPD